MDKAAAINITRQYAEAIKTIVEPENVVLFGSYAKGTATENSDIDIAVFVKENIDYFPVVKSLWKMTHAVDNRIEPVVFTPSDDSVLKRDVTENGIFI